MQTQHETSSFPSINWDDPTARLRLAEQIGPHAYNEAIKAHHERSAVARVNGYRIRPVMTRFGRLFQVDAPAPQKVCAFRTLAEAESHARTLPGAA